MLCFFQFFSFHGVNTPFGSGRESCMARDTIERGTAKEVGPWAVGLLRLPKNKDA